MQFLIIFLSILAMPLAMAAEQNHNWFVLDEASRPSQGADCVVDDLGFDGRCSSNSGWQAVGAFGLALSCGNSDSTVEFQERNNPNSFDASWPSDCALGSRATVRIGGKIDCSPGSGNVTYSSTCEAADD